MHSLGSESKTLKAWAKDSRCVVTLAQLRSRLHNGWEFERALTEPLQRYWARQKEAKRTKLKRVRRKALKKLCLKNFNGLTIANETQFVAWFCANFSIFGFSELLKVQTAYPDVTAVCNGRILRVELEYKSSNFVHHDHDLLGSDLVICFLKDWELQIPSIGVFDLKDGKWELSEFFRRILNVASASLGSLFTTAQVPNGNG